MSNQRQPSKTLHIAPWIVQALLAAVYLMAGLMKLSQPIDKLSHTLPWVMQVSVTLVRFIGACEFLGAAGLILPSLLRIEPSLTPIAAIGLVLVQMFALYFHVLRDEASVIGLNFGLRFMAAFVTWGRFKKVPITSKATTSPVKNLSNHCRVSTKIIVMKSKDCIGRLGFILFTLLLAGCFSAKLLTPTQSDVDRAKAKYPGYSIEALNAGKALYQANCKSCHGLKDPASRTEAEWNTIVPAMSNKVNKKKIVLDTDAQESILRYLVTMSVATKPTK